MLGKNREKAWATGHRPGLVAVSTETVNLDSPAKSARCLYVTLEGIVKALN